MPDYSKSLDSPPIDPQNNSSNVKLPDLDSGDNDSPESNPSDADILPIRGKFSHLNADRQRLINEWGAKVYTLARLHSNEIILNGDTTRKAVSLTFDDGPDNVITPQILAILKANNIQATFCYVGTQMQYFPEIVKQTTAEGHQIIDHTFDHPRMSELKPADMQNELSQGDGIITNLTGLQIKSMRPPYGDIDSSVVKEMKKEGKTIVLWSLDSLDWADDPPDVLVTNVLDNVRPGDIILMHSLSNRSNTAAALPLIIKGLQEQGYSMVKVDQLTGRDL
jgi:peptidoglycan/xylan/chitin deacetylase (PgdA/CDA1 family)